MFVRLQIAALIFMMAQAVFFGVGVVLVLATPLKAHAAYLIPLVILISVALAAPTSWKIAPLMRSKHQRRLNAREA